MANRLARESSPYLLQHANNPVEWFPWGEEAFASARQRDTPIFLSIVAAQTTGKARLLAAIRAIDQIEIVRSGGDKFGSEMFPSGF